MQAEANRREREKKEWHWARQGQRGRTSRDGTRREDFLGYYKILGLEGQQISASHEEIKTAFRSVRI